MNTEGNLCALPSSITPRIARELLSQYLFEIPPEIKNLFLEDRKRIFGLRVWGNDRYRFMAVEPPGLQSLHFYYFCYDVQRKTMRIIITLADVSPKLLWENISGNRFQFPSKIPTCLTDNRLFQHILDWSRKPRPSGFLSHVQEIKTLAPISNQAPQLVIKMFDSWGDRYLTNQSWRALRLLTTMSSYILAYHLPTKVFYLYRKDYDFGGQKGGDQVYQVNFQELSIPDLSVYRQILGSSRKFQAYLSSIQKAKEWDEHHKKLEKIIRGQLRYF